VSNYKFPSKTAGVLFYMTALSFIFEQVSSYRELEKEDDTKIFANILLGMWSTLIVMPILIQATRGFVSLFQNNNAQYNVEEHEFFLPKGVKPLSERNLFTKNQNPSKDTTPPSATVERAIAKFL
jgi:hypothetical protein